MEAEGEMNVGEVGAVEARLEDSPILLRALYEASPDMVFLHDDTGRLIDVNSNTLKGYGYSRSEMLSLPFKTFSSTIYTEQDIADKIAGAVQGQLMDFEWIARRKGGEEFPVEVRLRRLHIEKGAHRGYILAIVRDLTERKQAEHERMLTLKRLEYLNRIASVADSTTDPDETLQRIVAEIRRIFNSSRAFLFHPCDPEADTWTVPYESCEPDYAGAGTVGAAVPMDDCARSILHEVLSAEGPVVYDKTHPMPENPDWKREYHIQSQLVVAMRPRHGDAWMLGVHQCDQDRQWTEQEMTLLADIANRTTDILNNVLFYRDLECANKKLAEAQAQLMHSEKMASIGQLAAGVAHEINNPLGYVLANFGILSRYLTDIFKMMQAYEAVEKALPANSPEVTSLMAWKKESDIEYIRNDIVELMAESQEGLGRVKKIIQDLKDFSRIDKNPKWEKMNLSVCIESTLNIVWNELKYKADIVREFEDVPEIECVPSQMNQVLMNLLVNAGQAIDGHGVITIRLYSNVQDRVNIEIADTGVGIPDGFEAKLFDPFFTTKPSGKGTGLGLTIVLSIIEKHGGSIDIIRNADGGATFKVCLPVIQKRDSGAIDSREESRE